MEPTKEPVTQKGDGLQLVEKNAEQMKISQTGTSKTLSL